MVGSASWVLSSLGQGSLHQHGLEGYGHARGFGIVVLFRPQPSTSGSQFLLKQENSSQHPSPLLYLVQLFASFRPRHL